MKKILVLSMLIGLSQAAQAHSPTILSPTWFKSLYQDFSEDKSQVWRGTVVSYNGGLSLTIRNLHGQNVQVVLIHLAFNKDADNRQRSIGINQLESFVGKQVYVLSPPNKDKVYAKLINAAGNDINLSMVDSGVFDVNETTLFGKAEKSLYLDALKSAQNTRIGIWGRYR